MNDPLRGRLAQFASRAEEHAIAQQLPFDPAQSDLLAAVGFGPGSAEPEFSWRKLLEWWPVDPGSVSMTTFAALAVDPALVAAGGHLRVGLEDAALRSERSNAEWVAHAATAIARAGGQLATAAEVRASHGGSPRVT